MRVWAWIVLVNACLATPVARAGSWLWPQDHGQAILTTTFADARKAYDTNGRLIATPPYRRFETRIYLEHGITDGLTFVGEGAAMDFSGSADRTNDLARSIAQAKAGLPIDGVITPGPQYRGLGLGVAGLRLGLATLGDYVVSAQATARAASSQARRFLDMRQAVAADARLLLGRSFTLWGMSGFLDGQIGYRSGGQNGPEARLDLTAGLRPGANLLVMAQSFSAIAPRGGVAPVMAAQRFQASAVYDVNAALSLQIGGVVAILGVNSPAERGVFSALWWRY
jgi:hypothetical protein